MKPLAADVCLMAAIIFGNGKTQAVMAASREMLEMFAESYKFLGNL